MRVFLFNFGMKYNNKLYSNRYNIIRNININGSLNKTKQNKTNMKKLITILTVCIMYVACNTAPKVQVVYNYTGSINAGMFVNSKGNDSTTLYYIVDSASILKKEYVSLAAWKSAGYPTRTVVDSSALSIIQIGKNY